MNEDHNDSSQEETSKGNLQKFTHFSRLWGPWDEISTGSRDANEKDGKREATGLTAFSNVNDDFISITCRKVYQDLYHLLRFYHQE